MVIDGTNVCTPLGYVYFVGIEGRSCSPSFLTFLYDPPCAFLCFAPLLLPPLSNCPLRSFFFSICLPFFLPTSFSHSHSHSTKLSVISTSPTFFISIPLHSFILIPRPLKGSSQPTSWLSPFSSCSLSSISLLPLPETTFPLVNKQTPKKTSQKKTTII